MSRRTHLFPRQGKSKGDTIVEVLIVMTILSVVLTGSFLVAKKSTQNIRDSEEHTEALQYLQGQTELLREAASHSGGLAFNLNSPFCLDANGHYPATDMTHCQLGSLYDVSIQKNNAPAGTTTTTFDLAASWASSSSPSNYVYLSYRVAIVP